VAAASVSRVLWVRETVSYDAVAEDEDEIKEQQQLGIKKKGKQNEKHITLETGIVTAAATTKTTFPPPSSLPPPPPLPRSQRPAAAVQGEDAFRLAWLWVEGWRAQLRKGGDIVEANRWEWRIDGLTTGRNRVPSICVKRVPGPSALKGAEGARVVQRAGRGRDQRKGVRWV